MGVSVDTYKYDYDKLLADLGEIEGVDDIEKLRNILLECGELFGDTYIITNDERNDDDGNPYYSLADLIDSAFGVSSLDVFDVILENRKEIKSWVDFYEIAERLSITITDQEKIK